jgi:hypothetical protein
MKTLAAILLALSATAAQAQVFWSIAVPNVVISNHPHPQIVYHPPVVVHKPVIIHQPRYEHREHRQVRPIQHYPQPQYHPRQFDQNGMYQGHTNALRYHPKQQQIACELELRRQLQGQDERGINSIVRSQCWGK